MYKVEKEIPIEKKRSSKTKTSFLRSLNIGDSFLMPIDDRSSIYQLSIQAGIKTKTRKESETHVRVWRTE